MQKRLLVFMAIFSCIFVAIAWAEDEVSIEGRLLMLDDDTPHVAVPVQAIRDGKVTDTVLSDESGKYRFVSLKPGSYQVRCQVLGGYVYYEERADGRKWSYEEARRRESEEVRGRGSEEVRGRGSEEAGTLKVEPNKTFKGIDFRFAPFKKGTWKTYTYLDGLASNHVFAVHRDPDGTMWFGTFGGGVSRYDGKEFATFTSRDGLASDEVFAIYRNPDGVMWFGTSGGVSRYDGDTFTSFTIEDGLASDTVSSIYRDPDGAMWFGTGWFNVNGNGVSRYDGKEFVNFTTKDGLVYNTVLSICRDPDGVLWFGTYGGGISRYDGKEFVNLTTKDGLAHDAVESVHCDANGVMWFGTSGGVSRYDGKTFINFTAKDGLVSNTTGPIYRDPDGVLWFGTGVGHLSGGGVSRYDGKTFVNFTTKDGLASNTVHSIYRDADGAMWFGTFGGGVSRYDEKGFVNLTTKDGLAHNQVRVIYRDSDSVLWIGTDGGGVSQYDGRAFLNLTQSDGLADNHVWSIHGDPDGVLWFGTRWGGVSRYDGKEFVNFTQADGLASDHVFTGCGAPGGVSWFGTDGGVSRYDGRGMGDFPHFATFTTKDGLADNWIRAIYPDSDGVMWFGTDVSGLSRYDGKGFASFTQKDGLASNLIRSIYRDPDNVLWAGTYSGVSRYDGKRFVTFTNENGLTGSSVRSIHRDPDGAMWFGTWDGGVSLYDSIAWTSLDIRDGLAGNNVKAIYQDADGTLWFGTNGGLTRYRRSSTPPGVRIVSVTTDQTYRDLLAIPAFAVGTRVTIGYSAIDVKTVPEKRQYRCRVHEAGGNEGNEHAPSPPGSPAPLYLSPTKETSFDCTPKGPGTYIFEVQAIDRDLNYSEPASVSIVILPPPFYQTGTFIMVLSIIGGASLSVAIILAVHRWRASRAEKQRLQRELDDARRMQSRLLPESAPSAQGFDIAGFSRPAREVGGDFFDYFSLADGKVGIALADVSGKGLNGAMNAVLANGMLHEVAKNESSCSKILSTLNADLYPRMEDYMFTTLELAILDRDAKTLEWANAGQHYPVIKSGGRVSKFEKDGGLPLGMMPDASYSDYQLELQAGDIAIFYSDGIVEAENEAEEMYGAERLEQIVTHIDSRTNAEEIIESILQDVADFVGDAEQYDDMTVVVVKRL